MKLSRSFAVVTSVPAFVSAADRARQAEIASRLARRFGVEGNACALAGAALAGAAALALFLLPTLSDAVDPSVRVGGIVVLFVGLLLTKAVPDHFNVLVTLLLAGMLTGLPLDLVFSGFHSSAAWVVFGGFIIATAIQRTGIGDRIAHAAMRRTGRHYLAIVYGIFLSGMALAFVLPTATGRAFTLLAICMAISDRLGLAPDSRRRDGLLIAATIAGIFPGYAVLPSTIPNMVMLSTAQNLYGIGFSYSEYFVAVFPVLAVFTLLVAPLLIHLLFAEGEVDAEPVSKPADGNGRTRATSVILIGALAFWATDFVHGVSPVWITLAAAVACLAPRFGPIREEPLDRCIHVSPWLVIAALVSIGGLVNQSGLGRILGAELIGLLDLSRGNDAISFAKIVGLSAVMGVSTTSMLSPAVLSAFAPELALSVGWSVQTTLLVQIPSWFFIVLPHQVPIILAALAVGGVALRSAVRFLMTFALCGFAVATPLYFAWLSVLGYFAR